MVLKSNDFVQSIDEEIILTKRYIADIYRKKFPELETLITNKLQYVRTVKSIGNEMDLTLVNLSELISPQQVMMVSVSASTTPGQPLTAQELALCSAACDEVMLLDSHRTLLLNFVESRMGVIAPNLCSLIGSRVAANLVGLAGGLVPLSKIPGCNIQVMGQEKGKNLAGLSLTAAMPHTGILFHAELVQVCVPAMRRKALKILAAKVALVARVDCYQTTFDGGREGMRIRSELQEHLEKLQEPQQTATKKALPIPEEKKRSKRGGKRVRARKERYMTTDLQKQQNKMSFTIDGGEYGDSAMGRDMGMIGSKDTGRVRAAQAKESKFLKKQRVTSSSGGGGSGGSGGSHQSSGISSSMAFTPVQGLELVNPNAAADRVREANKKWFNSQSGFLSAAPK